MSGLCGLPDWSEFMSGLWGLSDWSRIYRVDSEDSRTGAGFGVDSEGWKEGSLSWASKAESLGGASRARSFVGAGKARSLGGAGRPRIIGGDGRARIMGGASRVRIMGETKRADCSVTSGTTRVGSFKITRLGPTGVGSSRTTGLGTTRVGSSRTTGIRTTRGGALQDHQTWDHQSRILQDHWTWDHQSQVLQDHRTSVRLIDWSGLWSGFKDWNGLWDNWSGLCCPPPSRPPLERGNRRRVLDLTRRGRWGWDSPYRWMLVVVNYLPLLADLQINREVPKVQWLKQLHLPLP